MKQATYLPSLKRQTFLLFLLFASVLLLPAQSEQTFDHWRQVGIERYNLKDFEAAITAFRLAQTMDDLPPSHDLDQWINKAFEGYVVLLQKAEEAARLEARASEMAGQAYKQAKINPTHALRIAEAAMALKTNSKSAKQQFHDIISRHPSPFYSQLLPHPDRVAAVAFSTDGQQIATGCWDGKVRLWDSRGKIQANLDDHQEAVSVVRFSPDGQFLLTGGIDNQLKIWDRKGTLQRTLRGHTGDIADAAFAPDGQTIASVGWDNHLIYWTLEGSIIFSVEAHEDFASAVAFSPDGKTLVTGGWDSKVKIWNLEGQVIQTLEEHTGSIADIVFSRDGDRLLTSSWDRKVIIREMPDGKPIQTILPESGHPDQIALINEDADLLIGTDKTEIERWSLAGKKRQTYLAHQNIITALATNPNGDFFLSGSEDHHALLWNAKGAEWKRIHLDSAAYQIAWSPDGRRGALGTESGRITFLDQNYQVRDRFSGHFAQITDLDFSSDGSMLVSASRDGSARVWTQAGETVCLFKGHDGVIDCVAFLPDDQGVVSAGWDATIRIWDLEGREQRVLTGHKAQIFAMALSPDGRTLATGSRDQTIRIWDLETGEERHTIKADQGAVYGLAFAPDGSKLASAGQDFSIVIRELDGAPLARCTGHASAVFCVAFSPDGNYLVSGGADHQVKVWDQQGDELQTFTGHDQWVTQVDFTPAGDRILSAGLDRRLIAWEPFYQFLTSGSVYQLNSEEQRAYRLEDSTEPVPEAASAEEEAYHPEAYIVRREKVLQENGNQEFWYYNARTYSAKAFMSNDLAEKIRIQQRAVDYVARHLQNLEAAIKAKGAEGKLGINKGVFSHAAYLHGQLALWLLADGKAGEARKAAEKAVDFPAYPTTTSFLQTRLALTLLFTGQAEEALALIREYKDLKLYDRGFLGVHEASTQEQLGEEAVAGDLILENIDFLENHGVTHPSFLEIRDLLAVKP